MTRQVDPKMAQAIADDIAELDGDTVEDTGSELIGNEEPCICRGGPGKNIDFTKRGSGLVDDNTLCSKCNGSGLIKIILG